MDFPLAHASLLIPAIGWTLLHFIWQGSIVGLGYAAARMIVPVERSEARYAAGLLALAIIAICPLATFAVEYVQMLATAASAIPDPRDGIGPIILEPVLSLQVSVLDRALPWLVLAWTLGVIAMTSREWRQWRALEQIAKRHARTSPELERVLETVARQLGMLRSVCVLVSDRIETPTLIGWLKPAVLLPTAVALGFPREQLELILAHELGHLRRCDHLVNLGQAMLETLLFYHPVVHWISSEVRNEREICCDRLVMRLTRSQPREYARTLAALEQMRATHPTIAIAATGGVLLDRVRRIVGAPVPRIAMARPTVALAFLAMTTLALVVTAALRLDKLDELAAVASEIVESVPRPTSLALGTLALQLSQTRKWELTVAKPIRIELPREPRVAQPDSVLHPVAFVDALPRSSFALADADIERDRTGGLAAIADIASSPASNPASKVAAVADLDMAQAARAKPVPKPVALRSRAPDYPEGVTATGPIRVDVSFAIAADGTVRDIRVSPHSPSAPFAAAAQKAMAAWHFDPATIPAGSPARFQQTFVFSKAPTRRGASPAVAVDATCTPRTGSLICRRGADEETAEPLTIIHLTQASRADTPSG